MVLACPFYPGLAIIEKHCLRGTISQGKENLLTSATPTGVELIADYP